jgi:N-acetylmuramoyl-L-alanine amidase
MEGDIMRIFIDGQQLPLLVKVSRDLLTTLKAMSRSQSWGIFYDPAKEIVYINSKSSTLPLPPAERPSGTNPEDPESVRLLNKSVCIDPGHGGSDPGACGPTGTLEKDNNLAIALLLREKLENNGAKVIMTRDSDRDVAYPDAAASEELGARIDIANDNQVDLFISIHNDTFTNPSTSGTTTYHYGDVESMRLAGCLQKKLVEHLGTKDRNSRFASFYVIRYTEMAAALIEAGFISNPEEELLMASADGRMNIAQALFEGIVQYFKV